MLYDILLIFICLFASLGIVELTIYIFNLLCSKKLHDKFYILADNFTEDEAEYVIRFLESLISNSGLDCSVCGIKLGENTEISPELLHRLKLEYRNIFP